MPLAKVWEGMVRRLEDGGPRTDVGRLLALGCWPLAELLFAFNSVCHTSFPCASVMMKVAFSLRVYCKVVLPWVGLSL